MDNWLRSAIDYIGSWIEFQMTTIQQPGVLVAFVHRGEVVAEHAFGLANLDTGEKLTPRHRFRIASHSMCISANRKAMDCFFEIGSSNATRSLL